MAAAIAGSLLAGCSSSKTETTAAASSAEETTTAAEETTTEAASESAAENTGEETVVRVGGLKGPTTMGLVKLMDEAANGESENSYEFTMVTAADEMTAMVAGGKVDIALLPANVASVLYNKTNKNISVIDINTLGVLYFVSADSSVTTIDQLKGKTVYLPGKGTTPEYALRYVLSAAGLGEDDVTLEFKSEASEVASVLAEDPNAIGLLPQPFVTAALAQNEKLSIIMDLTKEWDNVQGEGSGSRLVTGVTIVNNDFLKEHEDLVDTFLQEHEASIAFTAEDPDAAAELIARVKPDGTQMPDLEHLVGCAGGHERYLHAAPERAGHDAHEHDDAAVAVILAVEYQGFQGGAGVPLGGGHLGHNVLQHRARLDFRDADNSRIILVCGSNVEKHPLDIAELLEILGGIPLLGTFRRELVVMHLRIVDGVEKVLQVIEHHLAGLLRKAHYDERRQEQSEYQSFFHRSEILRFYNPQEAASFCVLTSAGSVGKNSNLVSSSISLTLFTQLLASP